MFNKTEKEDKRTVWSKENSAPTTGDDPSSAAFLERRSILWILSVGLKGEDIAIGMTIGNRNT